MQNICDYKIKTTEKNDDYLPEEINSSRIIEIDCNEYNSSSKAESNITLNQHGLNFISEDNKVSEECNNVTFPSIAYEPKYISLKRKGEKYFPHFKTKVVSYALKHSIKKAASDFKVNKGTISGWIHESQHLNKKKSTCNEQGSLGPDIQFINWLKSFEGNHVLNRQDVVDKVRDIIDQYEKQEPSKTNMWFFLYAKRLTNESCLDKIQIKYPLEFKNEVANCTKSMSKKMASKVFNIDRKRICEWANDLNSGRLKKRDVSKYVTDPKVDKMIWDWYCLQQKTPSSKEIRLRAAIMYQEAGFSGMRCSPGWYYRWRMRYQLPTARGSQASRDAKILAWALIKIDENKSICHSDILKQASMFKETNFKASSSWVFRFLKKYVSHFKFDIVKTSLPTNLIEEVNNFKKLVFTTIKKHSIELDSVVAFDEMPLNFSTSDSGKDCNFLGKNAWENCNASVIVSCLASGKLLPTALILKNLPETGVDYCHHVHPILVQKDGINDNSTMEKWLKVLLKYLALPAMIISDIYDPHLFIKDTYLDEFNRQNINFIIIPGGCSSQLQPLLYGVIQKFKEEIENHWVQWCHESSGNFKHRNPMNKYIVEWVRNAHCAIANSCEGLIKESFTKAGIMNH